MVTPVILKLKEVDTNHLMTKTNMKKKIILRHALLVFAAMMLSVNDAYSFSSDKYASRSKLAQGHWVKIQVKEENIYTLDYDQLIDLGFNEPEKVHVYGWGGNALSDYAFYKDNSDDMVLTASYNDPQSRRLYFYGEGDCRVIASAAEKIIVRRNMYHTAGYYFLSDIPVEKEPVTYPVTQRDESATKNTHLSTTWYEEDLQNPSNAGTYYQGRELEMGESMSFPLDMTGYVMDSNNKLWMTAAFAYKCTSQGPEVSLEGPEQFSKEQVGRTTFDNNSYDGIVYNVVSTNARFVPEGDISEGGTYDFVLKNKTFLGQSYFGVDYVGFSFLQYARLDNTGLPKLLQYVDISDSNNFTIGNADEDVMVVNVSDSYNTYFHQLNYNSDTREVTGSFSERCPSYGDYPCRLIAFRRSSVSKQPVIIGEVANQNIHGKGTPEMVILTTPRLLEQAKELADIHTNHGVETIVFTQDDVFNEFSSGTPHAFAYSKLCKMFYDRSPDIFKYLLIYGAGVWDNRHIVLPDDDHMLTFQCHNAYYASRISTSYTHDGFFGMLSDYFGISAISSEPQTIAVGRLPLSDPAMAAQVNKKIAKYLETPPSVDNYLNIIAMSDDGDRNTHFTQSRELITKMINKRPTMTMTQGHNLVYPWTNNDAQVLRQVVSNQLKRGAGLFAYSGHGDHDGFSGENLWRRSNVRNTSYDVPPLALLSTCTTYEFDRPDTDLGIASLMVFQPNGGMIGAVAACRPVYMDYNQHLNLAVAEAYANANSTTTIGEIFRQASNSVRTSNRYTEGSRVNTLCYNLCGDPALKVSAPTYRITINGVSDKVLPDYPVYGGPDPEIVTINPLTQYIIKGDVKDSNGNVIRSFNGDLTVTIYESPIATKTQVKTTISPDSNDKTGLELTLDQEILSQAQGRVVNGHFEVPVTVGYPSYPGETNRIVVTATYDDSKTLSAAGLTALVKVAADAGEVSDLGDAPMITDMYLDTPLFTDGDMVKSDAELVAKVKVSDIGLKFGTAIGGAPRLILDNVNNVDGVDASLKMDSQDDGIWTLNMPLSSLAAGRHSLTFSVKDNANRSAQRTINFVVSPEICQATLSMDTVDPADRSYIILNVESAVSLVSPRLVIEDELGNTVLSRQGVTFPYRWDLKNNDGQLVADGHYSAFVIAGDKDAQVSTRRLEVPVIK